jgi:hypothetical protein
MNGSRGISVTSGSANPVASVNEPAAPHPTPPRILKRIWMRRRVLRRVKNLFQSSCWDSSVAVVVLLLLLLLLLGGLLSVVVDEKRACFRIGEGLLWLGSLLGRRRFVLPLLLVVGVWKRQAGRDTTFTAWQVCRDGVNVEKLAAVAVALVIFVPRAAERDDCAAMRRTAVVVV